MRAEVLAVRDYRNFPEYRLALDPGTTVLVGRNAVGKTNLIEALQLLSAGTSFRKPRAQELLRTGAAEGRIELTLGGDGRAIAMRCDFSEGKKTYFKNGKRVGASEVRGILPAILFCPDHLDIVKRSASVRRAAIDEFGAQLNAQYDRLASSYERILTQRNNLLKDPACPSELLEVWTESLVTTGAALIMHRRALLGRLRGHLVETYRAICADEEVEVAYRSSIGAAEGAREQIEEAFSAALEGLRDEELRRGMTLAGPHRDDLVFSIDGRPARDYASQGQQRSIVLAWKLAEVQVTRDILGQSPLLLLDDVMSELDAVRRGAIMAFVAGDIQTVVTTTNLGYFSEEALRDAKVVEIGEG